MLTTCRSFLFLHPILPHRSRNLLLGMTLTLALSLAGCGTPPPLSPRLPSPSQKVDQPFSQGTPEAPPPGSNLLNEATLLTQAGKGEQAAALYRQILSSAPSSPAAQEARAKLAEYELSQGWVEEAMRLIQQGLHAPPTPSPDDCYGFLAKFTSIAARPTERGMSGDN